MPVLLGESESGEDPGCLPPPNARFVFVVFNPNTDSH